MFVLFIWVSPESFHVWLGITVIGYLHFYDSWWQCRQNIIFLCKDCEHSVVQLTRPVKLRRTPFRSRQSLRASIIYKGPAQFVTQQSAEALPSATDQVTPTATCENVAAECGSTVNGALPHTDDDKAQGNTLTKRFISIPHILEFQSKFKSLKNINIEQVR